MDLALAEAPRPAWVRGVLGEVLGKRPGTGPGDPGTTRAVLELTGWRVSGQRGAAEHLGMKPTTLEARMKKLGITRKE